MSPTTSKRKLSNVNLTRKFHYQYMGLWMVITIALLVVLNLMFYLLVSQRFGFDNADGLGEAGEWIAFRPFIIVFLCCQTFAFAIATIYLAKLTSHRIAGPYIGLLKTCAQVRAGDKTARRKFRDYDRLNDLEQAFNAMLDSLTGPSPKK